MLNLKTDRPLAVFDIEATGTNARTDRIIDLAIVRIQPNGTRENFTFRFNPERPIPAEASAIHGIYDDDVRHSPKFRAKAKEIDRILTGCDLGGYNLIRFDIPMLQEEFCRCDAKFDLEGRRIIDAQKIYHQREPRDLSAALAFYCNELHLNAHGALDDVLATIRVIEGQFEKYRDLPREIDELDKLCNPRDPTKVDSGGKFKWVNCEAVFTFGPHQGRKLRDIAQTEKSFLQWMMRKDFPRDTIEIVKNALEGKFPQPPAAPEAKPIASNEP
jgi:DNA polymerase-3 subunit epsilon